VICLCNKLPIIDMKNAGAMRRPIVIPVETQITKQMKNAPRAYSKGTTEKFGDYLAINEGPGIWNLLMRALKNYQARGYQLPAPGEAIEKATADYIRKNNTVKQFVDQCCKVGDDPKTFVRYWCNGKEFFDSYENYVKDELKQKNVMLKNNIIEVMEAMGYRYGIICDVRTERISVRGFDGIRLATMLEQQPQAAQPAPATPAGSPAPSSAAISETEPSDDEKKALIRGHYTDLSKTLLDEIRDDLEKVKLKDGTETQAADLSRVICMVEHKTGRSQQEIKKAVAYELEIGNITDIGTPTGRLGKFVEFTP